MLRWMAAALAAAVLALAGCGGSGKSSSGSTASSAGSTLNIAAAPSGALKFTKSSLTAKAGKVTIAFANRSSTPHGVVVTGHGVTARTKVVTNGDSSTTATLKPGTYTFYCPVPGHRQAGMAGTITVS